MRYQHTQIGTLMLAVIGILLVVFAYLVTSQGWSWNTGVMLVVAVVLSLFSTLTVTVNEEAITLRFAPGIIQKTFPLKEIASYRIVKNPWYYGWGIHCTPHGWLYNVSGSDAVELTMKSGKQARIGTDEADALAKALDQAIKSKTK